jgi:integrase
MRESDVTAFTARLREQGRSKRTASHYVVALKHFAAWLERDRRIDRNPLTRLDTPSVDDADLKHVRRVLSEDEFARLLKTARESKDTIYRLTGPDRMMLYVVAAYTGFRAGELHSMTPGNLALLGQTPTATVRAGYTKNSKEATNPLHADLVALLQPWVEGKPKDKPLWPGRTWHEQGARMLRADLAAAGIPYRDDKGNVFDFHALRCQFITGLALAGVHPAVAQVLARHSKPELTLNVYTKLNLKPQADAVNRLPSLPGGFVA